MTELLRTVEREAVRVKLQQSRRPVEQLIAPAREGIYAIFAQPSDALPVGDVPSDGLVYIGRSGDLAERDFETHFKAGASGFSTVRRSIGALLKDELGLTAIPRGTGSSDVNFRNYRFTEGGEKALSGWMAEHLELGVAEVLGKSVRLEQELITWLQPILCSKGWPNSQAAAIQALRAECVAEARRISRS
ncbi:MAG: GIY-YIG nuclease family protein [Actinomycetota bacterium]